MSHINQTDDNSNNGLITKIWGSPGWIFGHSVTFGYPIHPTDEQKKDYYDFFVSFGKVLPCKYCRQSYGEFISSGDTILNKNVLENRESLTKWFYRVHNAVNRKLGIDYGVSYEDVVKRYESFRAKCSKDINVKGCVAPLDYKAQSYKNYYCVDAPIIPTEIIEPFVRLAKRRGMNDSNYCMVEFCNLLKNDISSVKKQSCWEARNQYCRKIIKYMREHAIPSVIENGPEKGLPTNEELKLILMFSSNLSKDELIKLSETVRQFMG